MNIGDNRSRVCAKCQNDVEKGTVVCPHCAFDPRTQSLKVTIWLLITTVGGVLFATATVSISPQLGIYAIQISMLAFILSVVSVGIAYTARVYRFGRLYRG